MRSNLKYFFVALMPFVFFPAIFIDIANRKKIGYFFLSFIFGLIVYKYIPDASADLARYYWSYEYVSSLDYEGLLLYFNYKPDVLMYYLMYFTTYLGGDMQIYLFLITFINVYILGYIYLDITKTTKLTQNQNLILFSLIFFSVSINWIIGASRYYSATSIIILAFYLGLFKRNLKGDLLIFLAPLFHFGTIPFVFIYFISKYLKINNQIIKYLFILSFVLYLIPKSTFQNSIKSINIGLLNIENVDVYDSKIESYTADEDYRDQTIKRSTSPGITKFIFFLKGTWFYFVVLYVIFSNLKFDSFFYLIFILANLLNKFPTISGRYLLLIKIFFSFYLILHSIKIGKIENVVLVFLLLLLMNTLIGFYTMNFIFFDIIFDRSSITLFTILSKEVNSDIIHEN